MPEQAKVKIAILGGGVGAMTTAFMLSDRPELRDHFDVTVYQMGWRLGGKGASGRNGARNQRIEEHGPHFFLGFYSNAFWLMQKCYRELARPAGDPLARWDDAFKPLGLITLLEPKNGAWVKWDLAFPIFPDVVPGFPDADEIPAAGGEPLSVWELIARLLGWLGLHYERMPAHVQLINLGTLLQHAQQLADAVAPLDVVPTAMGHLLHGWIDLFARHLDVAVAAHFGVDDTVRRLWILLQLGAAMVKGLIADDVANAGFDSLDGEDLRDWLQRHGAADLAVRSAPVQAIYDLVFAYVDGDTRQPNLAAGAGLRGALRMFFDYKGAIFWKMQAGMGDVIFAPIYQVLKRRGVKFRFFERVDNLVLSQDQQSINAVELTVQATVKPGLAADDLCGGARLPDEYCPLTRVNGLPCWPSTPLYDQLVEGEQLKAVNPESAWTTWQGTAKTLRKGADFDIAVLGISLGALPFVCKELAASHAWKTMVEQVRTAQTQSFQVWLNKSAEELGWAAAEQPLITSYAEPFNAVVDMSQAIVREQFPAGLVQSIAYLFGPLQDADVIPPPGPKNEPFPREQEERVKQAALDFLRTLVRPVWPGATDAADPNKLDWNVLVDLANQVGEARFDAQFWRANIDPSERYVLSVKGSTPARLPADASGFDNLFLAGDWTATGLNAGCAEAAVMSGMRAARKIAGYAWRIVGEDA